jgi:type VI secretion system protein ImpC
MSRFPYLMTTSRFAHYLRAITRDSLGSFKSREECEHSLNAWISQYASDTETLSQAAAAARPLSAASVQVVDDETLPGAFKAIIYLRPRFQIGELDVSFKLVVDLPEAVHF